MNQKMIKHFLRLHKNGGKLLKINLSENEIVLSDGYLFFIQENKKMVLNKEIFFDLDKDIFTEIIKDNSYEEGVVACYLATYRKNKFNVLIKNKKEDIVSNRVILDNEKLELFDYHKLEIKGQIDVVKIYDTKGKLLGGLLPIRCSDSTYSV